MIEIFLQSINKLKKFRLNKYFVDKYNLIILTNWGLDPTPNLHNIIKKV